MASKRLYGPAFLSSTYTTNVYNNSNSNVKTIIKKFHFFNVTGSDVTFRLYLGGTGANVAGTELFYQKNVVAFDEFNEYGNLVLLSTDFLVGGAASANAIAVVLEGVLEAL